MITIGEIARQLGVSADTLKRWEDQGKIPKPQRTIGDWRIYSDDEANQLKGILKQQVGMRHKRG